MVSEVNGNLEFYRMDLPPAPEDFLRIDMVQMQKGKYMPSHMQEENAAMHRCLQV